MPASANSYVPGSSALGWTTSEWQSARPTDSDMIPGNAYDVAQLGRQLGSTAALIRSQIDNLNAMADGAGWDSDSGREFQKKVGDTAATLGKVLERYQTAATVIGSDPDADPNTSARNWAAQLQHAQTEVSRALSQGATAAEQSLSYYNQIEAAMQTAAAAAATAKAKEGSTSGGGNALLTLPNSGTPALSPDGPTPQQIDGSTDPTVVRLRSLKRNEDSTVDQAMSTIQAAIAFRDEKAHAAASAIESEINSDGLRDPHGFWHDVADAVTELGHVMGALSAVFGLLALVCSFVPFLAPLAAMFGALAMITGVIGLVCDFVSALDGQGTWLSVGIDLIAVVSCGAGRTIGESAELASRAGEADEAVNSFKIATKMAKYQARGFQESTIFKVIGGDQATVDAGKTLIKEGRTLPELTDAADRAGAAAGPKGWAATLGRTGANSVNPVPYFMDMKGAAFKGAFLSPGVFDPEKIKGAASVLPFKSVTGLATLNGLSASLPLVPAWLNLAPDPSDPGIFQSVELDAFG